VKQAANESLTGPRVFERGHVAIDGSEAGREAAAQAGRLVAPGGAIELATAIYVIDADLQHRPRAPVQATVLVVRAST
jgi:hypothetical protein